MSVGLLTDRINNKLEKSNLINEHALNREPVPLRHASNGNEVSTKIYCDVSLPWELWSSLTPYVKGAGLVP